MAYFPYQGFQPGGFEALVGGFLRDREQAREQRIADEERQRRAEREAQELAIRERLAAAAEAQERRAQQGFEAGQAREMREEFGTVPSMSFAPGGLAVPGVRKVGPSRQEREESEAEYQRRVAEALRGVAVAGGPGKAREALLQSGIPVTPEILSAIRTYVQDPPPERGTRQEKSFEDRVIDRALRLQGDAPDYDRRPLRFYLDDARQTEMDILEGRSGMTGQIERANLENRFGLPAAPPITAQPPRASERDRQIDEAARAIIAGQGELADDIPPEIRALIEARIAQLRQRR